MSLEFAGNHSQPLTQKHPSTPSTSSPPPEFAIPRFCEPPSNPSPQLSIADRTLLIHAVNKTVHNVKNLAPTEMTEFLSCPCLRIIPGSFRINTIRPARNQKNDDLSNRVNSLRLTTTPSLDRVFTTNSIRWMVLLRADSGSRPIDFYLI